MRLRVTLHSLAFLLGLSFVFVALGFSAGFISDLLFDYGDALRIAAGALLILMGAVTLHLVPLPFLQRDLRARLSHKPAGYAGSALVGVAFGAGWTPCIGPVLTGILALAGSSGSAWQGGLLLGVYSLGFAAPFLVAAQFLTLFRKLGRYAGVLEKVGGALLVIVGTLLLTDSVPPCRPIWRAWEASRASSPGARPPWLSPLWRAGSPFYRPACCPSCPLFWLT